jgi:hypothetical protein
MLSGAHGALLCADGDDACRDDISLIALATLGVSRGLPAYEVRATRYPCRVLCGGDADSREDLA